MCCSTWVAIVSLHPLLGRGVGHPVAAQQHLLVGEREAGDLPADREPLEEELRAPPPGVVDRGRRARGPLADLADRQPAQRLAQDQRVALLVAVLDRRGLLRRGSLLAPRHRLESGRDGRRAHSSLSAGRRRPDLRWDVLRFCVEPALARGAGRPGRAPAPRDPEAGRDPRREAIERELAVARLAPRILGDGGDHRPRPLQQPRPLGLVEGAGGLDVEDRFDPRRGDVRVLAAGAAGAARAQLDLRQRDREAVVDLQLIGHGAANAIRPGRRSSPRARSRWR